MYFFLGKQILFILRYVFKYKLIEHPEKWYYFTILCVGVSSFVMDKELFEITASMVTVEITDEATGEVFRRELPIDYYENANFLRLSGENLDGSVSQLVFYSSRGLERMNDLTGKGPDKDPCGGHSH